MARAWIELPEGSGWGEIRAAIRMLDGLGYTTAEVRGARVWLRLSGSALDVSALWIMPQ